MYTKKEHTTVQSINHCSYFIKKYYVIVSSTDKKQMEQSRDIPKLK